MPALRTLCHEYTWMYVSSVYAAYNVQNGVGNVKLQPFLVEAWLDHFVTNKAAAALIQSEAKLWNVTK